MEEKKSHRAMVKELDVMPKDVTSEEADFLEEVIGVFDEGKKLKPKVAQRLEGLYEKYLGVKDAEEESAADPDADEDIDEDDIE